jgi:hypothetical protein
MPKTSLNRVPKTCVEPDAEDPVEPDTEESLNRMPKTCIEPEAGDLLCSG